MEVLQAKKGRVPLQFKPKSLEADEISDDEYNVLSGTSPDLCLDQELQKILKTLNASTFSKKQKQSKFLSITENSLNLSIAEIEDDFKRESSFTSLHLKNMQEMKNFLLKNHYKIGDPNPQPRTFLKNPEKKVKKPKKMKEKQKPVRFEDNFDFSFPELEEKDERKKTFSEYQREKSERLKNKNRPGKRSRERFRSRHRSKS
jgi:hypothetical protein